VNGTGVGDSSAHHAAASVKGMLKLPKPSMRMVAV
jgi:hypothetical protein